MTTHFIIKYQNYYYYYYDFSIGLQKILNSLKSDCFQPLDYNTRDEKHM